MRESIVKGLKTPIVKCDDKLTYWNEKSQLKIKYKIKKRSLHLLELPSILSLERNKNCKGNKNVDTL